MIQTAKDLPPSLWLQEVGCWWGVGRMSSQHPTFQISFLQRHFSRLGGVLGCLAYLFLHDNKAQLSFLDNLFWIIPCMFR